MSERPAARRRRVPSRALLLSVGVLLGAAISARAAVVWASESTLDISVVAPDVVFEEGAGGGNARWIKHFEISANQTAFTASVKAKAGADTHVTDVVRLTNRDDASRTVTFSANQVADSNFEAFTWTIRDGSSVVTAFDYRAASPSASFSLPGGATYEMDLRVDLADGAGRHNARIPIGLGVRVD